MKRAGSGESKADPGIERDGSDGRGGDGYKERSQRRGGGHREGRGEAETGGTKTSGGERGGERGTSQRSEERGAENDRRHQTPNGEAPAGGSPR